MKRYRLSKSKMLSGLQCQKRLWLEVHEPDLLVWDASAQKLFDIGHEVGEVARQQFPGGVLVGSQDNLADAIDETTRLLQQKHIRPVYEGTFSHDGVLVRADILVPNSKGHRLIEVKSSTSLKDYYIDDVAIQSWVIEQAGFPHKTCEVAHINNQFEYQGDGNYEGLFVFENVSELSRKKGQLVPQWIADFKKMLQGDMPCVEVGAQCNDPFDCPFIEYCTGEQSEYPVEILPRGGKVVQKLKEEGIEDVRAIPAGYLKNSNHERVRRVSVSGKAEIDPALNKFVKRLAFPRYFLDFETIQFAVPIWAGTRPYQQLPFQYSLHIESEPGVLSHKEFLDLSGEAPMKSLAKKLIEDLGDDGPVIVYGSFEATRLKELAQMFPAHCKSIERIISRIVDLHPSMRNWYYHPAMMGSWSIKAVLPTIAPDLDYSNLTEVHDGTQAQQAYLEAISPATDEERKSDLRERMLEYCAMDTLAMVRVVGFFNV